MGRIKETRNSNFNRPKKTGTDKRRRVKTQRQRLVSLGMPEADVENMNPREVRTLLKHPAKLAAKSDNT